MKKVKVTFIALIIGLFFGTANVLADDFVCTGTFIQGSFANVIVPSGASCTLERSRVKGNILVQAKGSLETSRTRIIGNIQSEGFDSILIRNKTWVFGSIQLKQGNTSLITRSTINGDVQFEENFGTSTAEFNIIGGSLQASVNTVLVKFLSNVDITGNIQSVDNTGGVQIRNNQTDANLQVYTSAGGIFITDNIVAENLQCTDNQPPLTESGNIIGGEKECSSF